MIPETLLIIKLREYRVQLKHSTKEKLQPLWNIQTK